jgi:tetratricopeptide (TPR) repeat protein
MAALGETAPAIDAFQRSLALNPSDAGSYVNLATCYSILDRHREAVDAYQKAFALDPQLLVGEFVNHEYGFTLVKVGRIDDAAAVFAKMIAEPRRKARGLRSLALLEMYRGRYRGAIEHLREAVLINRSNRASVSEFRDRLFLARAFAAKGQASASAAELASAERLIVPSSLGPEWVGMLATLRARAGRVAEARSLLATMSKTSLDATAGSSANRDASRDERHLLRVRGEIALAEGRPDDAAQQFEAARVLETQDVAVLESLSAALVAAGRLEEAITRAEALIAARPFGGESQESWLRAHVTLGEMYERAGRADAARRSYEQLVALWKDGDADLVVLAQARSRLAKLTASR